MKYAKIAAVFVAMIFVVGQAEAGNRRAIFDQLAKGIKSVTDADTRLVISKSDIMHDVESYFGSRRIADRFEQVLQDPEGQKDLINDVLYLVYGKSSSEAIFKIGQSAAIRFNTVVKNWKAVNETCRTEGCSQGLYDLINLSGPDNWKPNANIIGPDNWQPSSNLVGPDNWKPNANTIGPDNWQPSSDGNPTPTPAPQK